VEVDEMKQISETAKEWGRLIRKYPWPDTLEKDIQKAINEATAEKDAEIERLRAALKRVVDAEPIYSSGVGSYGGGETHWGFSKRLKNIAEHALAGGEG